MYIVPEIASISTGPEVVNFFINLKLKLEHADWLSLDEKLEKYSRFSFCKSVNVQKYMCLTHYMLMNHNVVLWKFKIFVLCYTFKVYVWPPLNRLIETVQMSGHNIYFQVQE